MSGFGQPVAAMWIGSSGSICTTYHAKSVSRVTPGFVWSWGVRCRARRENNVKDFCLRMAPAKALTVSHVPRPLDNREGRYRLDAREEVIVRPVPNLRSGRSTAGRPNNSRNRTPKPKTNFSSDCGGDVRPLPLDVSGTSS